MGEEYEVEDILDFGYIDGELSYQVKWSGYDDPKDFTWEPYYNLASCKSIIKRYFNRIGVKKPPNKETTPNKPLKYTKQTVATKQTQNHQEQAPKSSKAPPPPLPPPPPEPPKPKLIVKEYSLEDYIYKNCSEFVMPQESVTKKYWFSTCSAPKLNHRDDSLVFIENSDQRTYTLGKHKISKDIACLLFPNQLLNKK